MTPTVYLGTSEFAAIVLRRLSASPHRPALVVSRPDAPQGRGRKLTPPPVALAAAELGLELIQPESVNTPETLERIRAAGVELAVVCAFGAIIKEPLLSALEIFNVHPSLLPRWRGAAPIERAIMAGDTETGVAIIRLSAGLDSGPVCLVQTLSIEAEDDYGTLAGRLETLGGDLLVEAIDARPPFSEQPEAGITYAEKITAQDRQLQPGTSSARDLELRVRALSPHIGAYLQSGESAERLGVWAARACTNGTGPRFVRCTDGVLELLSVQPPGKRRMDAADWARGLAG